jgi:hypothetical protein
MGLQAAKLVLAVTPFVVDLKGQGVQAAAPTAALYESELQGTSGPPVPSPTEP